MDELDKTRIELFLNVLDQGRRELANDPETGFFQIWSSRLTLISTSLKNTKVLPREDVIQFVKEVLSIFSAHDIEFHLENQNEIVLLALATGDVAVAKELAAIDCCEDDSHKFDRLLNRKLRSMLTNIEFASALSYRPRNTEATLFNDLDAIRNAQSCSLSGVDQYWKATRTRRYRGTVFEHTNLFRAALLVLQNHLSTD